MSLVELVKSGDAVGVRSGDWGQAELDAFDDQGLTPLMHSAILGYHDVALALKEKGADVDIADADGRKAVHHAAKCKNGMVMIMLIEGGCGG